LKEKLWKGEMVQVQVENWEKNDYNFTELHKYRNSNAWLAYLLILSFSVVVIGFVYSSSQFNSKNLIGIVAGCLLLMFGVFAVHNFDQPNKALRYSIVKEVGKTSSKIKAIETNSIEAKAAAVLLNGQNLSVCLSQSAAKLGFPEKKLLVLEDEARNNLILNGLVYVQESYFLGIGPGAYISYTRQKKNKYEVGTIVSPYNSVIEIVSQYGVFISGLLIVLFGFTVIILVKSFFSRSWSNQHTFAVVLLVCLILLRNANSRFLSLPINWVIISFVFIETDELIERHKKRKSDSK